MSSIFLSHSHKDKHFTGKLNEDLKDVGIKVWFDEAEIRVGDSLIQKITEGLDEMEYIGAILSSNSVSSNWVKKELEIAMNDEINGKKVKVLPILIEDCSIPLFLQGKLFADFRDFSNYNNSFKKLVETILPDISDILYYKKQITISKQYQAEVYNRIGMIFLTSSGNILHGLNSIEPDLLGLINYQEFNFEYTDNNKDEKADDSELFIQNSEEKKKLEKIIETQKKEIINALEEAIEKVKDYYYFQAFSFFKKGAELGDIEAMWNLGWRFWLGEGTQKNETKAIIWWKRA